jgi:hypothetical protein
MWFHQIRPRKKETNTSWIMFFLCLCGNFPRTKDSIILRPGKLNAVVQSFPNDGCSMMKSDCCQHCDIHCAFIMFIWFSSPRDDLQHSQYFVLSMFIMFITSMKVFCTCLVLFRGHVAICFVSRTFARRCLLQPTTPGWTVRPWRSWRVRPLPRPSVGWWIVDVHTT